jgi:hypothetical protein
MALPAAAAGVSVQVIAPPNPFDPGATQQLQVQVTNNSSGTQTFTVTVEMDANFTVGTPQGCNPSGTGACTVSIDGNGAQKQMTFPLTAKSTVDVPSGQTAQKSGSVSAQSFGGSDSASFQVGLNGPAAQAAVPQLSGVVVDVFKGDSGPIANAKVAAQDSAVPTPHTWEVGTDKTGAFKIVSTPQEPIAPGTIVFIVTKDGYEQYKQIINNAVAGQPLTTLHFAMTPIASTASASATGPTPTGPPVSAIDTNQGAATGASNSGGGGGLSWVLIGIGGVLVALGIAAIVILLVRRRGDDDDDDENAGPGGRGPKGGRGAGPRPPQQGGRRPEPTMVMRGGPGGPGGRGPGGPGSRDQTMIARSPLADMPTQMHGRVPPPGGQGGPQSGPGYGGGQGGYGGGGHQQPGYGGGGGQGGYGGAPGHPGPAGAPPNYGQPDPYGSGYGQQQGGYGQPQQGPGNQYPGGYDEQDPRGPRRGDRRVDWLED